MATLTEPPAIASRPGSTRWRSAGYWLATVAVVAELGLGGSWDIARLPSVRDLVTHLGYPSHFLVLLGSWKVDRKSTRLNSSHEWISYAVFCLKKKKKNASQTSRLNASQVAGKA